MKEEKCRIVENRNLQGHYYLMKIEAEYVAQNCRPGNFVMLAVSGTSDPLLKRPFGILTARPPHIWIYYEVIGKGTGLMSGLKENERVTVLGPLGNAFPPMQDRKILTVAGGRGIAPIFYAIEEYAPSNEVYLIYGAKSAKDLNLLEELEELHMAETFLYTDDGSAGKKGFVTTDIKKIIAEKEIEVTFSCGPDAMFECLAAEIGPLGTENYVSMEAVMGCGFGICYSCAVKARDGNYRKVCTDGPVFLMESIQW